MRFHVLITYWRCYSDQGTVRSDQHTTAAKVLLTWSDSIRRNDVSSWHNCCGLSSDFPFWNTWSSCSAWANDQINTVVCQCSGDICEPHFWTSKSKRKVASFDEITKYSLGPVQIWNPILSGMPPTSIVAESTSLCPEWYHASSQVPSSFGSRALAWTSCAPESGFQTNPTFKRSVVESTGLVAATWISMN